MGDLRGLIEAVEAGTATAYDFGLMFPLATNFEHTRAWEAYLGSLDAAKALHDALLPGWWASLRHSTRPMVTVGYLDAVSEGHDDSLARAWLLAILRALEAEGKA